MLEFEPDRGFGIYVHWPYCAKICPYCDFNVYANKARDIEPLLQAIFDDLKGWRAKTGPRRLDTVFLGGGTPSLLPPDSVNRLLALIGDLWDIKPDIEITLEANPDDYLRFSGFADTGINRLSLGVQSLSDRDLKFLGRNHDVEMAHQAIQAGRQCFDSLSLDFIYALPDQSIEDWRSQLNEIVNLGADHLSLYELTIAQKTAFGKAVERGAWKPADDDVAADLYELTQSRMIQAGYPAYEVSNHARDESHHAKHNIIYWRSGDWLGIGPGAHGRVTSDNQRVETIAARRPQDYIRQVADTGQGVDHSQTLSIEDVANERLMMGMRMVSGMARSDYESLNGRSISQHVLEELKSAQLIEFNDNNIKLTSQGRLLADHICTRLILE
ncbi:radical SAM family heme chaperone HemW [Hirschia litorea]|uniref:Heme chaperone HemW n=1 Tax=Hirschia litorea TaxID=1199156 RepID=A0ABW2IN35_9PROT